MEGSNGRPDQAQRRSGIAIGAARRVPCCRNYVAAILGPDCLVLSLGTIDATQGSQGTMEFFAKGAGGIMHADAVRVLPVTPGVGISFNFNRR